MNERLDAVIARAPQVKTQSPGYYRMMLGDFEVTALSDGTLINTGSKLVYRSGALCQQPSSANIIGINFSEHFIEQNGGRDEDQL